MFYWDVMRTFKNILNRLCLSARVTTALDTEIRTRESVNEQIYINQRKKVSGMFYFSSFSMVIEIDTVFTPMPQELISKFKR